MESIELAVGAVGAADDCAYSVVKGKRTKRKRLLCQPPAAVSSSSSSTEHSASTTITEEEEDMANCLILLAKGRNSETSSELETQAEARGAQNKRFANRRFTGTDGKAGFYVYECKTCNKCFPSFQALGGHRASHKKPRMGIAAAPVTQKMAIIDGEGLRISMNSFLNPAVLPVSTKAKAKVHECSICGVEFASGQALGGHMRRHRPVIVPEAREAKKVQSLLSLDLNLPAPSDDDRKESARPASKAFAFVDGRRPLLFSSTLVDCHY